MIWSYVAIEELTKTEIQSLVTDAWTTIVPKKVWGPYLAGRA